MDDIVRVDILKVLDSASRMIERGDIAGLKELSDHTIHNSSIFQDEDSVSVAVIIYTLAKIFEREKLVDKSIISIILHAKRLLLENNFEAYRESIRRLYKLISRKDQKTRMYIQEVISQAGVRKSAKVYDHGISMARAANILGVSQWDVMDYIGKTKIPDSFHEKINLKRRIATARKLFMGG